jgi:prepilin-type N-terminal cleavage/methylation domain-containing protein
MEPQLTRHEGFSLLEVIVALVIITLTLFLTFQINSNSIKVEATVQGRLKALYKGEKLMEEYLSTFPAKGTRKGEEKDEDFPHQYSVIVSETPHPDVREVNLTLTWLEGKDSRSITLTGVSSR